MLFPHVLSQREYEVLELVALGLQNNEIAQSLTISVNTVEYHLKQIYRKLQVHNRMEASKVYWQVNDTYKNYGSG